MEKDPEFFLEHLKQIEILADDILSDRRDIIELNKKKEKSREAIRALKTSKEPIDSRTWLCCGNLFIGLNKQDVSSLLEKDKNKFESQIDTLHKGLKKKVNKLYDAENKPELKGFDLIPFTKEEKQSLLDLVENKTS